MSEPILLRVQAGAGPRSLADYRRDEGMNGLAAALDRAPEEVTAEVKSSRLRGRGGAGFPTGIKWSFLPRDHDGPTYLLANADEGEPGTFKDRELMARDPHLLLEGMAIAGYAIGASIGIIYLRGEYDPLATVLRAAIAEAELDGSLGRDILGSDFDFEVLLFSGAGSYVCGEETALLDSLSGRRGEPRAKPPYPAIAGLYGCPTVVNNVETLCCLPFILRRGGETFAAIGAERTPGPKLFSLSGGIQRPGVVERPTGIPLRELIDEAGGGPLDGHRIQAVFPGGLSSPLLLPDDLDVTMDFDALLSAGSTLGSGGVIVLDDRVDLREVLHHGARFFAYESCGKCAPCREGTAMMAQLCARDPLDAPTVATLERLGRELRGLGLCALCDSAAGFVQRLVTVLDLTGATGRAQPPRGQDRQE